MTRAIKVTPNGPDPTIIVETEDLETVENIMLRLGYGCSEFEYAKVEIPPLRFTSAEACKQILKAWKGFQLRPGPLEMAKSLFPIQEMPEGAKVLYMKEPPSTGELERLLVPEEDWERLGAPAEAIRITNQKSAEGVPTGIAKHPTEGWFVIQSSGQGPYIIWQDQEQK